MNLRPITLLDGLQDVEIVGWVSDFTHLREQLPVMEELRKTSKVCFITNKNDIESYIKDHTLFKVGKFKFANNNTRQVSEIIHKYVPQLKYVLVGNDLRSDDGTLAETLNKLNVPYGVITHGLNYLNTRLHESKAPHLFVWADEEKQRMMNQGIEEERIFVSGSPYFFSLTHVVNKQQIDNVFRVGERSKILVAISGAGNLYSKEEHQATINYLNSLALTLKSTHFFINKLHRKDKAEFYLDKEGLNVVDERIIPSQLSKILDLIQYSNIVISGASTSVIEAMLLRKPVIIFDRNPKTKLLPFVAEKAVLFATDLNTLEEQIKALDNPIYRQQCISIQDAFIKAHFGEWGVPSITISQIIKLKLS